LTISIKTTAGKPRGDEDKKENHVKRLVRLVKKAQRPPAAKPDIVRPGWITFEQTADLIEISKFTLYRWKNLGLLNEENGLRRLGRRRYRIEWLVFKDAVSAGRLG
jgi:hypothetical protein